MTYTKREIQENLKYLQVLAQQYPTVSAASTEIINLQAILGLPKGTEHFMSDLHGEYEAFEHILNNASGVIKEKVDILFSDSMTEKERAAFATLVYYPQAKLDEIKHTIPDLEEWYRITLNRLIALCRLAASKYTRSKVRKSLPQEFGYIMDELLHLGSDGRDRQNEQQNILSAIIEIDRADAFIEALCAAIKRLTVDRLHIVGDIFDRGPRADIILDSLIAHHSVDIQWGNHDILWMGAAAGSRTCIANVLNNSITYNNLQALEMGYGINLRPLALFANETYAHSDVSCFLPRLIGDGDYKRKDIELAARMHKAVAILLFKLEGQVIRRNPSFRMEDRLLLDKIDYNSKSILVDGRRYALRDCDFPTVSREDPYALTREEAELMEQLASAFCHSEKLQRHVRFLYANGGLYKCHNGNLLFHGCIPMDADGSFTRFDCGETLSGRAYMDYVEAMARQGYYARHGSPQRQYGKDFLWFLWCGHNSPLFGRDRMATFERLLIADKSAWVEKKNPYYQYSAEESSCLKILQEFGLTGEHAHIINGHVPVRSKDGESPVKANGRLIVIDGGFCRAYQPQTGIAGYTLVYNSYGIRLISHEPFESRQAAIEGNKDILSSSTIFETLSDRLRVADTDIGRELQERSKDLHMLLAAYRMGLIQERTER